MISQCKGKDLIKIPASKLLTKFIGSIKYDGHYVQIHKKGTSVRFFTSGGKEFYLAHIANELVNLFNENIDFVVEAEYIANTTGKLGNRGKAAKLTTYRTNFEKDIKNHCIPGEDIFKVFDCIYYSDELGINLADAVFTKRLDLLKSIYLGPHLHLVDFTDVLSLEELKDLAHDYVNIGYEGMYLKAPDHLYKPGKRVNDAIKLKYRPTADLRCVGTNVGEGKYDGMVGSLILQDANGKVVSVGSGLNDLDRLKSPNYFIGKVIEIEYEQILDTYIQPTYIGVREDKEEID